MSHSTVIKTCCTLKLLNPDSFACTYNFTFHLQMSDDSMCNIVFESHKNSSDNTWWWEIPQFEYLRDSGISQTIIFLFPKSTRKPVWKSSLKRGVWMNWKFPCVVERKVIRRHLEGTDTGQLGITQLPASLPAPTHTYPDFTQVERDISALNCRAGKILDIYNYVS